MFETYSQSFVELRKPLTQRSNPSFTDTAQRDSLIEHSTAANDQPTIDGVLILLDATQHRGNRVQIRSR
jgi:hypothetical protein